MRGSLSAAAGMCGGVPTNCLDAPGCEGFTPPECDPLCCTNGRCYDGTSTGGVIHAPARADVLCPNSDTTNTTPPLNASFNPLTVTNLPCEVRRTMAVSTPWLDLVDDNVYNPVDHNALSIPCVDLPNVFSGSVTAWQCLNWYGGRWVDIDAPTLSSTQIAAVEACREIASPQCNGTCPPCAQDDYSCSEEALQCTCWERELFDCLNADTASFPPCTGGCTPSTCSCYGGGGGTQFVFQATAGCGFMRVA